MKVFVLCASLILSVHAYPQWFHEYNNIYKRKLYSDEEAYNILRPKYDFAQRHGYDLNHRSLMPNRTHNPFRLRTEVDADKVNHRLGMPLNMDWRTHGAVTSVKKQGKCGCCFSFAAVGSIEFWYWKITRVLKDFSVQQWVDCTKGKNFGCDGGLMQYIFQQAMTEPAGPESFDRYLHHEASCLHRIQRPWLKVINYVSQTDQFHYPIEANLAHNIVQYGPIPVAIDSSSLHFELYQGGILKESRCGKDVDHAVLVVGFTPQYWIVKNSWGPEWGLKGYFHLERGKNACGINSYASFITDATVL